MLDNRRRQAIGSFAGDDVLSVVFSSFRPLYIKVRRVKTPHVMDKEPVKVREHKI